MWQHCKQRRHKNQLEKTQTFSLRFTSVSFQIKPELFIHPAQTASAIMITINLELLHTLNVWASDRHLKTTHRSKVVIMRIVMRVTSFSATQGARNNEKAQGFDSRCFEIRFCDALASLPVPRSVLKNVVAQTHVTHLTTSLSQWFLKAFLVFVANVMFLFRWIWRCIRYTFWFLRNLRRRPGSQVVEPLLVEMFVPKLFTLGLKHALGLTLPFLFVALCVRFLFFVADECVL